jgi:hypothetical protein
MPSVFTVANVKSHAEAADAVEAKKLAVQSAQAQAFRQLVARLTDFRAGTQIPDLTPEDLERLVAGIEVRGEGVSGTSYVATFGVTFSERAVASLFSQYGATPIMDRGPEILIVPVYIEEGTAKATDRNPWRIALAALDLTHALVPARLAPARSDITAGIANAYVAHPSTGVDTLKSQYHTPQIFLAVAELDGSGDSLTLKLCGNDALGLFSVQRKVKAKDGIDEAAMQDAARIAFETVQQRWMLTRESSPASNAMASPGAGDHASFSPAGGLVSLQVTAEFTSLKEWQTIRARLQSVPGVQNWDLRSVNPRSAEIGFDFPGGAERLAAMAAAQGLTLESGPDGLVVKTR